jgi:hypothetical protein
MLRHHDAPAAAWGSSSRTAMQTGCVVPRPVNSSSSSLQQVCVRLVTCAEHLNAHATIQRVLNTCYVH